MDVMSIFDKISLFGHKSTDTEQKQPLDEHTNTTKVVRGTYYDFLEGMRYDGYDIATVDLLTFSSVEKLELNKDIYGTFLQIRCPAGRVLVFPGIEHFGFDKKHFSKYPNLYKYPYFLNIRCFNEAEEEPYWSRIVVIRKLKPSSEVRYLSSEYYDDLHIKADSRYKRLEERYYLKESVMLAGGEILEFLMESDVDITNVELFGKADLFTKHE